MRRAGGPRGHQGRYVGEGVLSIESIALARAGASSTAGALARPRLRDGEDGERVHPHARVVRLQFAVAAINDVVDAVDCERRLGDVGSDDDLARAALRLVEDLGLQLGGQQGVDGEDEDGGHLRKAR